MDKLAKPTAQGLWAQYSGSPGSNIKDNLNAALGLTNLKACDPPSATNASYYAKIEAALGPAAEAAAKPAPSVSGELSQDATTNEQAVWVVKPDRAWLYAQPSVGSSHRGYLIHGDRVTVIRKGDDGWLQIHYERVGKQPIEAWLQAGDLTR
ncbi:hypothetical protein WJ542_05535 [Paraburkholderia sp. B3]|uniref:hypothetical protein n=1 Tax=Paraburkholderia sp. B3 TaxID=3134791 RepID=UPI0039825912